MARSKVIVKKSNASELLKRLEKVAVYVGLPSDSDPYPNGTSVVQVGTDHEFGSDRPRTYISPRMNTVTVSGVPERSFLRSTAKENRKQWANNVKREVSDIIRMNSDTTTMMSRVGIKAAADVRKKIVAINDPANSPQVIAEKGSSNPLIDTGHLLNSITYDVRAK